MRKQKYFNLLILQLLLLTISTHNVYSQKEGLFTISGTVVDSATLEPLYGVYILAGKSGTQTDKNGEFALKDIPAGEVDLTTIYFSSYSKKTTRFYIQNDTVINFVLSEPTTELDEVVVTGTRTEKRLSEAPIQTMVIKSREIQKAGASSTLESLTDNIPGIVVTPNAMGNNMRIKGLNSRYILFLVDGERMVAEGAGGNINLSQIDVNNIERIEMVSGAGSALYGSNAVGAVINIITKKPAEKFEAGANIIAESNNTWQTKAEIGSKLKKLSARMSGSRSTSDGFGSDGGAFASQYEDWNSNMKLSYNLSDNRDINLTGRFFRHETFNPSTTMNTSHPLTYSVDIGVNGGFMSADKRNDLSVSLGWNKYYDYDVFERLDDLKEKQNSADYLSTRIVNTFKANDRIEIVGGVEFNHEENFALTTLGPEPTTKYVEDINLFGQTDIKPVENLDIVAGARYTYNSQFGSAFSPKLSLMYDIGGFKFRGGIGSAFRAPSIKELYYDFDHNGSFWVYGNKDLEAENGLYTSLSAEYTKNSFNSSISAYYNDIDNKITQYKTIRIEGDNSYEDRHYKNVSSSTLKGFDFNISYVLLKIVTLKGTYSYCDAVDNSTGLQLDSNVKHSGTLSTTWNGKIVRSPFSLQLSGRMNSPIKFDAVITDEEGNETTSFSESRPYSIWKLTFVKPFNLGRNSLELTMKCDNIFNFSEESFINPGRTFYMGLRYAFR